MDQEVSAALPLPFRVEFGFAANGTGRIFDQIYIHRNGTVTFDSNLAYSIPQISALGTPSNATGSITYGSPIFLGRPAFCVTWTDMESSTPGKKNSFQLLLVDVAAGNDDFDMYFNYKTVSWEDNVEGSGLNVGFVAGNDSFGHVILQRLPGSFALGQFLDSNPTTGLINRSGNIVGNGWSGAQKGQYITRYSKLPLHRISGFVKDTAGNPVSGISVVVTNKTGGSLISSPTQANGYYEVSVPNDTWYVDGPRIPAFPLLPNKITVVVPVMDNDWDNQNLELGLYKPPVGTGISPEIPPLACPPGQAVCIKWTADPVTLTVPAACTGAGTGSSR